MEQAYFSIGMLAGLGIGLVGGTMITRKYFSRFTDGVKTFYETLRNLCKEREITTLQGKDAKTGESIDHKVKEILDEAMEKSMSLEYEGYE